MIDLAIISIVLSGLSAIGVGVMTIMRRIKICKSCCCFVECDDPEETHHNDVLSPSVTENSVLFDRIQTDNHLHRPSPLRQRASTSPININPLLNKPHSTL